MVESCNRLDDLFRYLRGLGVYFFEICMHQGGNLPYVLDIIAQMLASGLVVQYKQRHSLYQTSGRQLSALTLTLRDRQLRFGHVLRS